MNLPSGKFIVVEGLEGAGKSTVIHALHAFLASQQLTVTLTREPGGTPMAEAIRDCVKHAWDESVCAETELLLMYAARVQLLENVIKPQLAQGHWVLADRHDWSSLAYQGGGRQIPAAMLSPIRDLTLKGFVPDFTLMLDIDPEIGLARAGQRGELDRIEQSSLDFFCRTREAYLDLARQHPTTTAVIDAAQAPEVVRQAALDALVEFMAADSSCIG